MYNLLPGPSSTGGSGHELSFNFCIDDHDCAQPKSQRQSAFCYVSTFAVQFSDVHVQEELMVRAVTLQEQLTATQTELREVGAMTSFKLVDSDMSGAGAACEDFLVGSREV